MQAIPARPRLVFIHGVNGYKKQTKWLAPLNRSLQELGMEPWDESEVVTVRYKPTKGSKDRRPARTSETARVLAESKAAYKANHEELSRVLAARGRRSRSGNRSASREEEILNRAQTFAANSARAVFFRKARRYRRHRDAVCNQILSQLGPGDTILVGYSLGSVVAADLLSRLRPDQHIRLLVTLGSPLAANPWNRTRKGLQPFPFDRLDAWVNIYSPLDPVAMGTGLHRREVVDVPVEAFPWPAKQSERRNPEKWMLAQHRLGGYASHAAFATAIAWALSNSA